MADLRHVQAVAGDRLDAIVAFVEPFTWERGFGTTGSRKISSVPPDRQGFTTDSVPAAPP